MSPHCNLKILLNQINIAEKVCSVGVTRVVGIEEVLLECTPHSVHCEAAIGL